MMVIAICSFGKWRTFAQLNHAFISDSNPSHEMFFMFKKGDYELEIWNVDIWETDPPQLKSSDELMSLRFRKL